MVSITEAHGPLTRDPRPSDPERSDPGRPQSRDEWPRLTEALIARLDVPGPRYTSYPTVPEWTDDFAEDQLYAALDEAGARPADQPIGLYVHLPFCEERCTFCGCNVVVTRDPARADRYLDYLVRELDLMVPHLGDRIRLGQIHLGGGTPTFLTEAQLTRLWRAVTDRFEVLPDAEVALEVDPVVTTFSQVSLLRSFGFNRISMGVQDFDPQVQEAVHRVQSVEETADLVAHARAEGFKGVNFDLIYGLPRQTPESWRQTLERVLAISPDRAAVYSFAYLPELRPHQKRLPVADIPTGPAKLTLLGTAFEAFVDGGLQPIGMDHFAKPEDELSQALAAGRLNRNFQGYSARPAIDTVSVGVTAISDVMGRYAQNVPQLNKYYKSLDDGRLPLARGMVLSEDDLRRRWIINSLMCNGTVDLGAHATDFAAQMPALAQLADDGLIEQQGSRIDTTPLGRIFVRNVAMVFDAYLEKNQRRFSRTV